MERIYVGRHIGGEMTVKKLSLRQAINAHCKSCVYDPKSGLGTWRQQVEGCTVTCCELYPVRPISGKSCANTPGEQPKGLKAYWEKKNAQNVGG